MSLGLLPLIGILSPLDATAGVLPAQVTAHELDNGLTVLMAPMDSPGVVSWQIWMDVGSRNEVEPGTTGFAHFFEHLMFYGTEALPRAAREDAMLRTGADENAWTWVDNTVYHSVVPAENLPQIVEIEADRFQGFQVTAEQVERESGAVYGEYRKGRSDPSSRVFDAFFDAAYTTHTYRHPTIGYEADIQAMPTQLEHVRRFFDTYYRPDLATIVVAGDFDPAALQSLIEQQFGDWQPGPEPPPLPVEPPQEDTRRVEAPWDGGPTNVHMVMGWKVSGFSADSVDSAALDVLSDLLLSDVAPLYRQLVVDDAQVYGLYGGSWKQRDPHPFVVGAELKEGVSPEQVEQATLAAIAELRTSLTTERLEATKTHTLQAVRLGLDNPKAVANTLGNFAAHGGGPDAVDRYYAVYQSLTVEQVLDTASRVFVPAGLTVSVLAPSPPEPEPAPQETP